jgi:hypothetical protein
MMQRWEPGARAAIVISEHYENMNRVVVLQHALRSSKGIRIWAVEDGKLLNGYDVSKLPERVHIESMVLGIEQWKLRLLEDGEPVVIRDARGYVES